MRYLIVMLDLDLDLMLDLDLLLSRDPHWRALARPWAALVSGDSEVNVVS